MMKLPNDPDHFKHFGSDPPDIKLKAWKLLQDRLASRDRAVIVASVVSVIVAVISRW